MHSIAKKAISDIKTFEKIIKKLMHFLINLSKKFLNNCIFYKWISDYCCCYLLKYSFDNAFGRISNEYAYYYLCVDKKLIKLEFDVQISSSLNY